MTYDYKNMIGLILTLIFCTVFVIYLILEKMVKKITKTESNCSVCKQDNCVVEREENYFVWFVREHWRYFLIPLIPIFLLTDIFLIIVNW